MTKSLKVSQNSHLKKIFRQFYFSLMNMCFSTFTITLPYFFRQTLQAEPPQANHWQKGSEPEEVNSTFSWACWAVTGDTHWSRCFSATKFGGFLDNCSSLLLCSRTACYFPSGGRSWLSQPTPIWIVDLLKQPPEHCFVIGFDFHEIVGTLAW